MKIFRTRSALIPTLLAPLAVLAQAQAQTNESTANIRAAAERFVVTQLGSGSAQHVIHVTVENLDPRLRLARCSEGLTGSLPPAVRLGARATVGVSCAAPRWTVYVPVAIETELAVLALRRAAARGSALTEADVEVKTLRVPGLADTYISSPAQLADRHLRQSAAPGTPLTADLLAADILVKRGQRVWLVASTGGFEVRAQGEAIADARDGRVRVLNLASRKIVEGAVESREVVRVSL
jgi:flagella basal body P-ring formation protein FlgA